MTNRLKDLLDAGQPAIGAQLRFGSPAIAELFGHSGYDWLVIDSEHAPQTPVGIQAQLQAIGNTPAAPVVRLPRVDEELIRLYLDMGAMGIIAPFIETPEDAALGAKACRYPPAGIRGFGPHRAAQYGLNTQEYLDQIAPQILFIGLIESTRAIDNIDAILAVDGLDSVIIGPVDLSYSLGVAFDYESPAFQDAQAKVAEAAARAGKPAGLGIYRPAFDPQSLQSAIDAGFRTILIGGDEPFLVAGCQEMAKVRSAL
jgi:4-hydroxy-2-oxoheptanedioate aldolase